MGAHSDKPQVPVDGSFKTVRAAGPHPAVRAIQKKEAMLKQTIFFELPNAAHRGKPLISGAYLFECDSEYNPFVSPCFQMKMSWIFATSLQIQDTIKGIQRRAKECDFDLISISGIAEKDFLNPFECTTELRAPSKIYLNMQKLQQMDLQQTLLDEHIQRATRHAAERQDHVDKNPQLNMQEKEAGLRGIDELALHQNDGMAGGIRRSRIYSDQYHLDQASENELQNTIIDMNMMANEQIVAKQIQNSFQQSERLFKMKQAAPSQNQGHGTVGFVALEGKGSEQSKQSEFLMVDLEHFPLQELDKMISEQRNNITALQSNLENSLRPHHNELMNQAASPPAARTSAPMKKLSVALLNRCANKAGPSQNDQKAKGLKNTNSSPHLLELQKLQENYKKHLADVKQQMLLHKRIIQYKLFTQYFLKTVQEDWLGFLVLSKSRTSGDAVGNMNQQSASKLKPNNELENASKPFNMNVSTVTTLVHRTGLALVRLDESTNQIIWSENDVTANTGSAISSSVLNPSSRRDTSSQTQQPPSQRDNNDYFVSHSLQARVQGTIFAIDILLEIIEGCIPPDAAPASSGEAVQK